MNHFGERIKELREQKGLLQKHVANKLDIDTPMLSKIERGERPAKKEHVPVLAKLFDANEDELLSLWLAGKVYRIVKNEKIAMQAMQVAQEEIKSKAKRNK
ncbi:MAG: helix-turn-helix transcriptional regulator [Bacteroidetes bacterium]|nr:helix-turn-helix transcriptional regulator [Bacteroidota bacterium]